jgi:hypothetical protein
MLILYKNTENLHIIKIIFLIIHIRLSNLSMEGVVIFKIVNREGYKII